ncbi:MAG: 16S rRNA (uracil(1498)-N(3))-methyltransferase, partial [Halioglobus sp.]|nr:16S rRNA (uracil(1498)-N(3))-methyltransferase [Halioglobus sp.]
MNLLLFTAADRIDADRIRVTDERLAQLHTVSGAAVGRSLRVGEIDGLLGTGVLETLHDKAAELTVSLDTQPPDKLPAILILALPRPKMLRRILRSVAEFGVQELHLVNSYRVEKSYWQTPVLNEETVRRYLLEGLAQSIDTVLPRVSQYRHFKPFVEDTLPALLHNRNALVAHPGAAAPCPRQIPAPAALVVGPEGGFT